MGEQVKGFIHRRRRVGAEITASGYPNRARAAGGVFLPIKQISGSKAFCTGPGLAFPARSTALPVKRQGLLLLAGQQGANQPRHDPPYGTELGGSLEVDTLDASKWWRHASAGALINLTLTAFPPLSTAPGGEITLSAPPKKGWVIYTVKPGDTLAKIAYRYGVEPQTIVESSGLKGYTPGSGQVLYIPLTDLVKERPRIPPGVQPYRIRSGDTLEAIAQRLGLSVLGLVSANPSLTSLDHLSPGSLLYLPMKQKGLLVRLDTNDTVVDLAARFGLPVIKVAQANRVKGPLELKAGDLVLLPDIMARVTYQRLLAVREEKRRKQQALDRLTGKRRREATRSQVIRARTVSSPVRVRRASYRRAEALGFEWPLLGSFPITTYYGGRTAFESFHPGLDIAAPTGTPIYAARAGQVGTAGWSSYGFGINVEINHDEGVVTRYSHLSRLAVRPGDWVEQGQTIGYVGSTGWSTGPHLDFRVRIGPNLVDPLTYLP